MPGYETLVTPDGVPLSYGSPADALATPPNPFRIATFPELWTGSAWELVRTPKVYKVVNTAVTAETTIWTPAAGKKFRLMGFMLGVDTGTTNMTLRDGTGGTIIVVARVINGGHPTIWQPPGNGILSAATNNVLTLQAASANTGIGLVWGTEE